MTGSPSSEGVADAHILVVDDEPSNVRLLERLLQRAGYTSVRSTVDPLEALHLFQEEAPDLVLLDLHMPGMDGFELMERFGALEDFGSYLPVIVLTADATEQTKQRALAAGAQDLLTKPFSNTEVVLRIRYVLRIRRLHRALQRQNADLEERVHARTRDFELAQMEILERLARAAEFRDDDTGEHTQRVGHLAGWLARTLGMDGEEVELIRRAAPLHDVGKIAIPDSILLKPGRLTEEEYELMKTHTTRGARLLTGGRSDLVSRAEQIALAHHERWDGSGYPLGLSGPDIPLSARIVAIADVADALSHDRPYRRAWGLADVRTQLERGAGAHFDPELVEHFLRVWTEVQRISDPHF